MNRQQQTLLSQLASLGPTDVRVNVLALAVALSRQPELQLVGNQTNFRKAIEVKIRPSLELMVNAVNDVAPLDFNEVIEVALSIIKHKHIMFYGLDAIEFDSENPTEWIYGSNRYFDDIDHQIIGTRLGATLTRKYSAFLQADKPEGK